MERLVWRTIVISFIVGIIVNAQGVTNSIIVDIPSAKNTISKYIYGHFAEHLGRCIYGGIWVGKNSKIPNVRGYRKDVLEALKELNVPVLRWPGGCFADTYHWKDGIGPVEKRPKFLNTTWGGVVEDNSFGTHEFLDFCELIGAEPYISVNVGSGTVQEAVEWVEYVNSTNTPMAELRKRNGREKPWNVKFWGIGNETWGCGGIMSADYYASILAQYSYFLKDYGTPLIKIASGGLQDDYNWTETVMRKWSKVDNWLKDFMKGYSLHYYTVLDWNKKGSATDFTEAEWFLTMKKTLFMNELINNHSEIMNLYDPEKKIGLIVDEWGTWFDVEPGTNPAFLYQQNTLRDALVAAVNLNIFNNHCDRVKMANIAQTVNVLQAVILTKDDQMVLTPTYYVFKMYKVHQNATQIPVSVACEPYRFGPEVLPSLSVSASKNAQGKIYISIANIDPQNGKRVTISLSGRTVTTVRGDVLTAETMNAYNDFGKQPVVVPRTFTNVTLNSGVLTAEIPSKSVVVLECE
ncbi:MAG: alpha-N-arabinofuranosidase [Bacteroidetes bacterium]|nr:alpha-N-arabinofuranosidase [Bacteroidota bacterium]